MEELPPEFRKRMRQMLRAEFPAFLSCMSRPSVRGIRLNPSKATRELLGKSLGFPLRSSVFSPFSYEIPSDAPKPGTIPLHHAGAFYSQEPSAASAVTILNPRPGEKILDLCAAPGGKSTQIAGILGGDGLLWSNEVVPGRAKVLLSNLERLGVKNAVVSSCHPEILCERLSGFFDRVLVDAPCSEEGMFRRDRGAVQSWSVEHVRSCAARQLLILRSAARAVRENGILVYSTCTFSREENEETVLAFLKEHPDFSLEPSGVEFGRPGFDLPRARRIFPMDGGDGHFAARLRRLSPCVCRAVPFDPPKAGGQKAAQALLEEVFQIPPEEKIVCSGGRLFVPPAGLPELSGLGVIRAGLLLGEIRTGRVEPAHALFLAAKPEMLRNALDFPSDSRQIRAFLHGEELETDSSLKGYAGVAVDGVLTGFGKCSGGRLKNRYPKGLRIY